MRRARSISLLLGLAVLAAAPCAQAAAPRPVVNNVTPLKASVGETMTVQGRNFLPGVAQNVVVFVRGKRVSYVRGEISTRESITVRLPKRLERLLRRSGTQRLPTRFRVKVISRRMGRVARRARARPTVGPDLGGDCDKDGTPNPVDTDDDDDGLLDWEEARIRTDPCNPDTDGDRLLDSFEYLSALDLNRNFLPYPGKRPYPNALQADAHVDHDGDGMSAIEEHAMWWFGGRKRPLDYSDGTQTTRREPVGAHRWNDLDGDGGLSDDERDFDGDGLANVLEARSFVFQPWQPSFPGTVRPNFLDRDSDGDGLPDGFDDQDHDDVSNIDEFVAGTWAMNPCDPLGRAGRTCPRWLEPGKEPQKPEHVCLSRTLLDGAVSWFKYELPEDMTPEELAKFC